MNLEAIITPVPNKIIRPRALIVEDDVTLKPIWEHVLPLAHKDMTYQWVSTAHEAEFALRKAIRDRQLYDIVISDIYLSSNRTGIDLWKQFGAVLRGKMLLVSSISFNKLARAVGNDIPTPLYIQKPLKINECVEAVHGLIHCH